MATKATLAEYIRYLESLAPKVSRKGVNGFTVSQGGLTVKQQLQQGVALAERGRFG